MKGLAALPAARAPAAPSSFRVAPPSDAAERQADAVADRVLRREENGKKEKKDDPGKVLIEGLKIVAEQAEKDKQIQEKVIKPIEKAAAERWDQLSGGEQAATVSFGAVTYGIGLGALLSSEEGREVLSGVNILAPTALIPYWPINKFSLTPPEDPASAYSFALGFDGTDILKRIREDRPAFPLEGLSVEGSWKTDADGSSKLTGLKGKFKFPRGIELSGGLMKGPMLTTPIEMGVHDDRTYMLMQTIPGQKDETPNIGGMVTIDMLKLMPKKWSQALGFGVEADK